MSHGNQLGASAITPRSKFYQGPFGRMAPNLEGWTPKNLPSGQSLEEFLEETAKNDMQERTPNDPAGDSTIPAAYTYFGQFVDHDITHDTTSLGQQQTDPNSILNFRTPRLDLDCLYGRGPEDQPYLFEFDANKALTGRMIFGKAKGLDQTSLSFPDLPRTEDGTALIGDKRNDENAIVAQIHLAFILAHNRLADAARSQGMSGADAFAAARKSLTRLYQWIVWQDFIARITDQGFHGTALEQKPNGPLTSLWSLGFKDVYNWHEAPFMPVEFSGAAYRFGHTMVRNGYRTNHTAGAQLGNEVTLFDPNGQDLRGGRSLGLKQLLQWDWFLEFGNRALGFPQKARKLDPLLSTSLSNLPNEKGRENILAFRNLLRGVKLELPSGPDMARFYGLEAVDSQSPALWFYILKEAQTASSDLGNRLGSLGSLILCSVFAGLLKGDPASFFNVDPTWTPKKDELISNVTSIDPKSDKQNDQHLRGKPDGYGLATIIRLSGLPITSNDFDRVVQNGVA